jgi:hypothetical protein
MSNIPKMDYIPASVAPDWLVILRATWATRGLRREAAAEVRKRGLELSGNPESHDRILNEAEGFGERRAA